MDGRTALYVRGGVLFVFLLVVALAAPAAEACPGKSRVLRATHELMAATRSGSPAAVRRVLYRHVDMRHVLNFALGRDIRRIRGKARERYYRRAVDYTARRLVQLAHLVRGTTLEVRRCSRSRVVTTLLPRGERVVWKLRRGRIVDVNVRGIWMAYLLRSHFRRMLAEADYNMRAFIARLD